MSALLPYSDESLHGHCYRQVPLFADLKWDTWSLRWRSRWLVAPRSNGATKASGLQAFKTGKTASVLPLFESVYVQFESRATSTPSKTVF
ncbi:MAG TPA: hypothetical protein V6D34_11790, partial [Candidatus Sericytochromatia bacterium]